MKFAATSRFAAARNLRAGLIVAASLLAFSGLSLLAQQGPDLYKDLSFR